MDNMWIQTNNVRETGRMGVEKNTTPECYPQTIATLSSEIDSFSPGTAFSKSHTDLGLERGIELSSYQHP